MFENDYCLQDWLDLECITYRSSSRNKNKAVPEKRKKKATSCLNQTSIKANLSPSKSNKNKNKAVPEDRKKKAKMNVQ